MTAFKKLIEYAQKT